MTENLTPQDISKLPVWYGKRQLKLEALFDVSKTDPSNQIVWAGDLSSVHWIGKHMVSGSMVVEGNVGRHLGSQMTGGEIQVNGSAGDYVGCEMEAGTIRIQSNAANWVGAAYAGTKAGMKGGSIFVGGDAGSGTGFGMRRGTLCIGGNTQRLTGWNMLAGSIFIGGTTGEMTGKGMVRGTVVLPNVKRAKQNRMQLPVSFTAGGNFQPVALAALEKWLNNEAAPVQLCSTNYQMYHGDQLKAGRGEVFIGVN